MVMRPVASYYQKAIQRHAVTGGPRYRASVTVALILTRTLDHSISHTVKDSGLSNSACMDTLLELSLLIQPSTSLSEPIPSH